MKAYKLTNKNKDHLNKVIYALLQYAKSTSKFYGSFAEWTNYNDHQENLFKSAMFTFAGEDEVKEASFIIDSVESNEGCNFRLINQIYINNVQPDEGLDIHVCISNGPKLACSPFDDQSNDIPF